jgi:hypothetical protein
MNKHWTELSGSQKYQEAITVAENLYSKNSWFREKCKRNLERYIGTSKISTDKTDFFPYVNISKSQVDTIVALLAANQNPKVQFVTSDSDWQTKRKSQKLDQFIDALSNQPFGSYSSVHDLRTTCLRDACIFGVSYVQILADIDVGRVLSERVLPWEVYYEQMDSKYNDPIETWRIYTLSRQALKEWFPEKEAEIDSASGSTFDVTFNFDLLNAYTGAVSSEDHVQVFEVWRRPISINKKGEHLLLFRAAGEAVSLIHEDWELSTSPFVTLYFNKPVVYNNVVSLLDTNETIEDVLNIYSYRIYDVANRTSSNVLLIPDGSVTEDQINETVDAQVITYIPNASGAVPQWIQPPSISQSHLQYIEMLKNQLNEISGISQLAQQGERTPGLNSGAAIRASTQIQSKRLAEIWRQMENWMLQWSRLVIASLRTISEEFPDFSTKWAGGSYLKQIKWSEVSLEDDQFELQIYPVSEAKNTPSDRIAKAEDMFAKGLISKESYGAIVNGPLDYQSAVTNSANQKRYIDKLIAQWLDANDEQIESGFVDYDKDEPELPLVPVPIKFMNLPDAIVQVAQAYLGAEIDNAPDKIKKLFRLYLENLDAVLTAEEQKRAELQAQAQNKNQPMVNPMEQQALPPQQ